MSDMDDLTGLLAGLPGADLLTPKMLQDALTQSLIPDTTGVWPGEDGYTHTYDVYFAAFLLVGYLAGKPMVTQSTSEGTSVTVTRYDWGTVAAYFRSMSKIASTPVVLRETPIPGGPHVDRVWMGGGDVDTDVA